jgi:hypothetical protein
VSEPVRPPADEPTAGPRIHSRATTALGLGIGSLFILGVVLGTLAIYMASKAEREIAESGGTLTGEDRARWGRNLGIAGIVIWAVLLGVTVATR